MHKTARLKFGKEHEKKPNEFWQDIFCLDETKINVWIRWWSSVNLARTTPMTANHKTWRSECADRGMNGNKRIWRDDIYWWLSVRFSTKILNENLSHSLSMTMIPNTAKTPQEFCKQEKRENQDLAEYVPWPESRTPLEDVSWSRTLQQNPSSKEQPWWIICEEWQNIYPQICARLVSPYPGGFEVNF